MLNNIQNDHCFLETYIEVLKLATVHHKVEIHALQAPLCLEFRVFISRLIMTAQDRKSTRLNSSHVKRSRMPSSA